MSLAVLFVLIIVAVVFAGRGRRRAARSLGGVSLVLFLAIGCGPVPAWLLDSLEKPFEVEPQIAWGARNAIVLLGAGTFRIGKTVEPGVFSYPRLVEAAQLRPAARQAAGGTAQTPRDESSSASGCTAPARPRPARGPRAAGWYGNRGWNASSFGLQCHREERATRTLHAGGRAKAGWNTVRNTKDRHGLRRTRRGSPIGANGGGTKTLNGYCPAFRERGFQPRSSLF